MEQKKHIEAVQRRAYIRPTQGDCFGTAQSLAVADADTARIKYHEGFVEVGRKCQVAHAWNTIDEKLFDLTLDLLDEQAGTRCEAIYFGVQVPTDEVERIIRKTRIYGSVLEEICRERQSSVHIITESRFIPAWHEAYGKVNAEDPTYGDPGRGNLINTYEGFLEAAEEYKKRQK